MCSRSGEVMVPVGSVISGNREISEPLVRMDCTLMNEAKMSSGVAPAGPVGPVLPVGPVFPAAPAGPVGPEAPMAPVGPVGPGSPAGPEPCVKHAGKPYVNARQHKGLTG